MCSVAHNLSFEYKLYASNDESILIESGTFGINVVESVMTGKHYVRSLKGLQMLKETMSRLQWVEFLNQDSNVTIHKVELDTIIKMRNNISNKSKEESMHNLQDFKDISVSVIGHFDSFISKRCEENEKFRYWNLFITMMTHVENLIRSDRQGD